MEQHDLKPEFINKPINIVFVDDVKGVLIGARLSFSYTKCKLAFFTSTKKALAYILRNSQKVDLIISDIRQHKMSGLELVLKIKNNLKLKHIKIILQTAEPYDCAQPSFLAADGYIQKPYLREKLFMKIEEVLNNGA